jgi:glycosyltransferase involved in cell wall biosynthesis
MRVLMLASYFPKPANPTMGTWALAQARALQRQGLDVRVVSFTSWVPGVVAFGAGARAYADCPTRHNWDGLEVFYPRWPVYSQEPLKSWIFQHPTWPMNLAWRTVAPALGRHVHDWRPDLVYAHHTAANGFIAAQLRRRYQLPFVVTDHDFGEIQSCREFPGRRRFFDAITRQSSCMVAVARRMEREMADQFPHARTQTVFNGTDAIPREFSGQPRPAEIEGKTVVFSCGMFYERKGFPLLIEAFGRIAQRYPDAVLRLAGDGAERAKVEQAIARHQLQGRVQLLGLLPHRQVLQQMVWSDLFALIGWDEPFATVFSEACSAGKPILTASDGGINDVLESGVHGLAVPPRDIAAAAEALDLLLRNPDQRLRMGAAARQLYEQKLNWDRNAREMAGLFAEAVERAPVPTKVP